MPVALGLPENVKNCEAVVVSTVIFYSPANEQNIPLPDVDEVVWKIIHNDLIFLNETSGMQRGGGSQYIINNSSKPI